jgi:hypothetical protein
MVLAVPSNGLMGFLPFRVMWLPLLLAHYLNGPTMGFAADKTVTNMRALATSAEMPASRTDVKAVQTGACPTAPLPRYYVGGYTMINLKGDPSPLTDPVRIFAYLNELVTVGIPQDRVLGSKPPDCNRDCPCEVLWLSENVIAKDEKGVTKMGLDTIVIPDPVISSSKVSHNQRYPAPSSVKNDNLDVTRSCLDRTASYNLLTHDQLHRDPH